ncbi:SusC/RagA family TonB-linked outer membrane protein [Halosquirtibacter xylanolyticus]|uniref:SusC/RagA family TonB-linked outer membrane protein n=1 Tax=Halosquirtibacter xylanolyticus TaxID=3374599 RepID=UPI0037499067|nr:SusC/RagA family TonB-linked outer membrane protein [Prolixibacteraceae bacterium]
MKKIFIVASLFMMISFSLRGQTKIITGVVSDAANGQTVPGVSVTVPNSSVGTVTNIDGFYSLKIPIGTKVLKFSYVGMKEVLVEIKGSTVNVKMESKMIGVDEVVVTALGISRDKKALGYAVQNVGGDELNKTKQDNVIAALSGKVSGVQVSGASGSMGGSSRILIRGASSVTGNNQPLFVVDGIPIDNSNFNSTDASRGAGGYDYGSMAQDINPEDIEKMTVLKGPSAAALYGSRAANGVIMITTKKGSKKGGAKSFGVSVNMGIGFESVNRLPDYQNSYGGGSSGKFDVVTIDGVQYDAVEYNEDTSWGPKYDSSHKVLHWDAYDEYDSANYLNPRAWQASQNDVKDFFETGVTYNNSVAFSGADDKGSFRMSISGVNTNGYMPHSNLDKYTVSFNGTRYLNEKLMIQAGVSYINTKAKGRPETGYGDGNVMVKFTQWGQRQLDMDHLSFYKAPDGSQRSWNRTAYDDATPAYSNNPYWIRYENYTEDQRNRYIGNIGLTYDILDGLKGSLKAYHDSYTFRINQRIALGSQETSSYYEMVRQSIENNYEMMFNYNKQLTDDFNLSALAGANIRTNNYYSNSATTAGGLVLPDLYTTTNSKDPATVTDFEEEKMVVSAYGSFSLGYKNTYYLDGTFRNDWSSSLPKENRSFFYPSFTASVVLSSLEFMKEYEWLSFGKIRAGWAMVGNDTDPYSLKETYTNYQPNFGGVPRYSTPNTLPNSELKPETTYSWEIGAELKFLKDRLGIDFTYYSNKTKDLITQVAISGSTGYLYKTMNAGEMSNKGVELMFSATPILTNDFSWDLSLNFAKNTNELVSLSDGITNYQMANAPFRVTVNASVGESYGAIMGTNYVYDQNGNKVISTSGRFLASQGPEVLGTVLPDYNIGLTNSFKYKNFTLTALIDMQHGGSYFSTSNMWGMYSGMLEGSVYQNGVDIREKGVVLDGVYGKFDSKGELVYTDKNGNVSSTPVKNTSNISGRRYSSDHYALVDAQNIFDASYIKLREVTFGYTFPNKMTGLVKNLHVGLYGRNLITWGLDNRDFDPEASVTSSGNVQGIEGGALPSTATYGLNIKFGF